ncbi:ribonuclease H-like domain-containing protein [Tanacetum coccineum]
MEVSHDLREPHLASLKRILRYVCGTLDYDLQLYSSSTSSLVILLQVIVAEAEYYDIANAVAETSWLRNLLRELHSTTIVLYHVALGYVRVLHVPLSYQYADISTMGLPSALFDEFCINLNVMRPLTLTARSC